MVNAMLATGLLALAITSLVLGVARTPAKVLAIQRTFTRVLGMVDTFDLARSNLVDV